MVVKQIHKLIALLLIAVTGISGCNSAQPIKSISNSPLTPTTTENMPDASTPSPLPHSPILCSQHPEGEIIQRDTVKSLTRESDGVSILFSYHAAIYFISKEDDCFVVWRDRLIESLKNNSEIEFAYIDAGQKIISIVDP